MRALNRLFLLFVITVGRIFAQSVTSFPAPDTILADVKHKEPKSGVQIGSGNTISIQSAVGTPTTINVLAFSRDSRLIAAGKDFGRVVVWDVGSRKFLCSVETGQGIVHAVALSADGQLLATAGDGDQFSLKLWHLPDGKLVRRYEHFNGYMHSAVFSPTGSWIVASDNAGVTHVLDSASDKRIAELKESYSPILSPQGDILMTVSKENFIVWATSDWTQRRTLPRTPTYAVPLSLSPETFRLIYVTHAWGVCGIPFRKNFGVSTCPLGQAESSQRESRGVST